MTAEQFLGIFIVEGREHLESLNDSLLKLKSNGSDEATLEEMSDTVDTLKGMADTIGFERISLVSNKTEELIKKVRTGKTTADEKLVSLMFRSVGAIGELIDNVENSGTDKIDISALINDLDYSSQLEHKIEEKNSELRLLQKINNSLNNNEELDIILRIIAEGIESTFDYKAAAVFLLSSDRKHIIVKRKEKYKIPISEVELFQKVVEDKEGMYLSDTVKYWEEWADETSLEPLAKVLGKIGNCNNHLHVPLMARGEVVGMIITACDRALTEDDKERLSMFGGQVGIAVQRAKLYDDWIKEEELKKYMESVKELTSPEKK